MKKYQLAMAIPFSLSLLLTTAAFASGDIEASEPEYQSSEATEGYVTVKGQIVQSTCKIETNSHDKIVNLGTVPSNELRLPNSGSRPVDFDIILVNCPANFLTEDGTLQKRVAIEFQDNHANVDTNGNLNNIHSLAQGGASNVQVQILNNNGEDKTPINLKDPSTNTQIRNLHEALDVHTLNFSAKFISSGSASAGKFESGVPFVISYK